MILDDLFSMADKGYADFQAKLTPTVEREKIIGVRVPLLREYAKTCIKNGEYQLFLDALPHEYYEENMLHALLISLLKDRGETLKRVNDFLPYVDNWAVCDVMKPKALIKDKKQFILEIEKCCKSEHSFTIRFGIEMLMNYYLDKDFDAKYYEVVTSVKSEEYYVKMMIAWYFATALAKQWDTALEIIKNGVLDVWTHNKTIQKAVESFRITEEEKMYLKTLKR